MDKDFWIPIGITIIITAVLASLPYEKYTHNKGDKFSEGSDTQMIEPIKRAEENNEPAAQAFGDKE